MGAGGSLARHGTALADLVERFGSPLHVIDGVGLERVRPPTPSARGGADVFFSYKTNPVPGTLRILHAAGIGAEVISPYELWLAMRLGLPGERLIYNGPAKSPESLRIAVEHGVAAINANTSSELELLRAAALAAGRAANVGLRVTLAGHVGRPVRHPRRRGRRRGRGATPLGATTACACARCTSTAASGCAARRRSKRTSSR